MHTGPSVGRLVTAGRAAVIGATATLRGVAVCFMYPTPERLQVYGAMADELADGAEEASAEYKPAGEKLRGCL